MPPTTRLMVRTKTKSISHCLLLKAVRRDRLLLLGDFNVRVGSERVGYEDMVGPHSRGECSENGARLLDCWDVLPATIYTLLDLVL